MMFFTKIKILKWVLVFSSVMFVVTLAIYLVSSDPPIYSTDSNFRLISEVESRDDNFKIIEYNFDTGAFGYSRNFWAIVPKEHSDINLRNYQLPDGYKAIGWTSQNQAKIISWDPYYRVERSKDLESGEMINGVQIVLLW